MLGQTVSLIDSTTKMPPLAARDFSLGAKKSPPLHVLVVDDEPLLRWSVSETLGARGYQVIEAGNGEAAIDAIMNGQGATDVVLLDLLLPDYCDLSLLAILRRLAPAVPIIMMTAFATPELVECARRLGAFAVVNKPFEMNELAPLISQALLATRPS
jgi:DNA-binding NtrC family response regulator